MSIQRPPSIDEDDYSGHGYYKTPRSAANGVKVAFDGSVQSAALTADYVEMTPTEDCFVEFGANPTAAADTSLFLVKKVARIFPFKSGDKVAAIKLSTAGDLYVKPVQ